jgi:hypothetical protein
MTVLDLSNWDYPLNTAALVAAGVKQVIIGCQDEGKADEMAGACIAAGIPVIATYSFLYFGLSVLPEVDKATRVARKHGIQWVGLDVEATRVNEIAYNTPPRRIADLQSAVAAVHFAGLNPFIYTGSWYWPGYMANTTEFSDLPLWHSEYPSDGHCVTTVNYGGWTAPHIHQYTSSLPIAGRNRDANYIITPLGEDMAVLDDLKAQLDALNKALVRREELRLIAANPDSSVQDRAIVVLQAAGLVDKSL